MDVFFFSSPSLAVVNDRRVIIVRNNDADDDHNNANTFRFSLSVNMPFSHAAEIKVSGSGPGFSLVHPVKRRKRILYTDFSQFER
jgi:hypothetical protein